MRSQHLGFQDGPGLLAVFAHPDDETISCGGTLARCADAGLRVSLLCATRGERGPSNGSGTITDLGPTREAELREAARLLGIVDVIVLDHPDGQLTWVDPKLLQAEIGVAIRHFRPDVVITFGADGLYWHPDHVAVHERTTAAVASFGERAPALYYTTLPPGAMRAVVECAQGEDDLSGDTLWGISPEVFGAHAKPPCLIIDVQDQALRKLTALRCYKTQIGPHHPFARISEHNAARLIGLEHFHRAIVGAQGGAILDRVASQPVRRDR